MLPCDRVCESMISEPIREKPLWPLSEETDFLKRLRGETGRRGEEWVGDDWESLEREYWYSADWRHSSHWS